MINSLIYYYTMIKYKCNNDRITHLYVTVP